MKLIKLKFLLLITACAAFNSPALAEEWSTVPNPGEARVVFAYTDKAADIHGGGRNLEPKINHALGISNRIHSKSNSGVRWTKVGWIQNRQFSDNRRGANILHDLRYNDSGLHAYARARQANMMSMIALTTDVGGIAYQAGKYSVIDAKTRNTVWNVIAHELGHNYSATHEKGVCWSYQDKNYATIMQTRYCRNSATVFYYSDPNVYKYGRYIGDRTHNNADRIRSYRRVRSDERL